MHVRGRSEGIEHNRNDQTFYKGIVVKNDDPLYQNRVKVYIPELTNQPLENWLQKYSKFDMRMPGQNNEQDNWGVEMGMYEEISNFITWAEPCFPLMGESSTGRFNAWDGLAVRSDSVYARGGENDEELFTPGWLWESTACFAGDAYTRPESNLTCNENPFAYMGKPSVHADLAKGVSGIPNIGSKVWVFHEDGDHNYPIYFGVRKAFRETGLIHNLDQFTGHGTNVKGHKALDYPGPSENTPKIIKENDEDGPIVT